jgi:hypothetical protein
MKKEKQHSIDEYISKWQTKECASLLESCSVQERNMVLGRINKLRKLLLASGPLKEK